MSKKVDFNKGGEELETIVQTMEGGNLGLEDSLKYFEQVRISYGDIPPQIFISELNKFLSGSPATEWIQC